MRKFRATAFALSCCLVLVGLFTHFGGDVALAAEAAVPVPADRAKPFIAAVKDAQGKLNEAVKNNDAAEAAKAADELNQALTIYRAEPTASEIKQESDKLAAWLKIYRTDATPELIEALRGVVQAVSSYRSAPSADEIIDRMDQLGAWLTSSSAPPSTNDEIAKALSGFVKNIAIYRGLGKPDFIKAASVELSGWIGSTNWTVDSNVDDLLRLSQTIIEKVRLFKADAAAASFSNTATAITGMDAESPFRAPWQRLSYSTSIKEAWTRLNGQVAAAFPVEWFTQQGKKIKALLGGDKEADIAATLPARTLVQNNSQAMDAAKATKDTVELLQGGYRPLVHIVDALYGDLPTGRYSRRVCNATRGMVTACERRDKCDLPPDYVTSLCGFDPIPSADDRTRAVAVQYSCFTGGDAVWDRLATHPLEDPFEFSDLTKPGNPATSFAILRGPKMELRCPFDAMAPAVTK
ncbi:hypothetical protein [Mesorhizobium australicum]|uniref:hypothetical protein n=1 Tax=Mesorhizobium australicum TaxID=536018 RepID=UPI003335DC54